MAESSKTAFVLGGGGSQGAYEVGMLRALLEAGIEPDLVVGTSVGAINGAVLAAEPGLDCVDRLEQVWTRLDTGGVFEGSLFTRLGTAMRSRTHLHSSDGLRLLLEQAVADHDFGTGGDLRCDYLQGPRCVLQSFITEVSAQQATQPVGRDEMVRPAKKAEQSG